ncbi:MAG TPA: XrtA system polysaccharide chain length determinant [Vicinamibacterales bacterium]
MLPGKKYTPEDILQLAWRRKWLIVLPFLVVSAGTAAVAWRLPDVYRSETLIAVVPQRVPDSYVKSTVTTKIEDRLASMNQKVLSRTSLERAILEFNLYPRERRLGLMEDVVERMRNDITITITNKGEAFRVSYVNRDPRMAMRVVDRLSGWFVEESTSDRNLLAQNTTNFLGTQLADARRRLEEHERRLAEYKQKHSGELPSEIAGNLQILNNTQMQLQAIQQSMNQDKDRRFLLEKAIAELSHSQQIAPTVVVSGDDPTKVSGGNTAAQLEAAKAQLQLLQLRLKDDHPDVRGMKRTVRDLQAKLQAEALQQPLSPGVDARPASPEEANRVGRLKAAQTEMEMLDRQIATKLGEEKRLRGVLVTYQARVESTAGRESELTSLMRDYDTLRKNYDSLLAKQEDSKVAAALEERAIGEQFSTIDPARLPEKPISPNRPMIDLMGAVAGLGLGLGLVALLEYRDNSFRTDDEVVRLLALPVMAVIPLMLSREERRHQRRRALIVGSVTAVVVLGVAAGAVWFVLTTQL